MVKQQTDLNSKKKLNGNLAKKILIASIITFLLGLIGYFIFHDNWVKYIFAHVGALGILGLFACLTGAIARKKRFKYRNAVLISFFPPIFIGTIADYLIDPPRPNGLPSSCGGSVSLGVAIIIVIIYLIIRAKK
jgi:hypothetical protein